MSRFRHLLIFLFSLLLLASCTVERRHYMPGWSVDWKKKSHETENTPEKEKDNKATALTGPERKDYSFGGETMTDLSDSAPVFRKTDEPSESVSTHTIVIPSSSSHLFSKVKPLEWTKRGYAILKDKKPKKTDQLILGILLFIGGLAAMIGIAFAYSGYPTLPVVAIILLVICLITCIVGYILIEDAVPGLGCLLLMLLQIFAAVLG
ncbi:MAG: hypothetical protein IT233_12485 [Bacteroidia bacterium]|nr:hypothetical protein [Bacteroidia bacterium]